MATGCRSCEPPLAVTVTWSTTVRGNAARAYALPSPDRFVIGGLDLAATARMQTALRIISRPAVPQPPLLRPLRRQKNAAVALSAAPALAPTKAKSTILCASALVIRPRTEVKARAAYKTAAAAGLRTQGRSIRTRVKLKAGTAVAPQITLTSSLRVFRGAAAALLFMPSTDDTVRRMIVTKNPKAPLENTTPKVAVDATRVRNADATLTPLEFRLLPTLDTSMRVGMQFRFRIGFIEPVAAQYLFPLGFLPPFGFRFFPGWVYFYEPRYITLKHYHRLNTCICFRTTITAPLTSPGGDLTGIGSKKNRKLRLQKIIRPDSRKLKPGYDFRLVLADEETPCACGGMFVGIYTAHDRVWGVGQTRPVMMLSTFYGQFPAYVEESNFKVVMVKNMMYDIAIQNPPEIPRYVLFSGGCGPSYMLVNAECE